MSSPTYASFLVRMWREPAAAPGAPAGGWLGEAEHIQTGDHWTFGSLDELLGLLRQVTEDEGAFWCPPQAKADTEMDTILLSCAGRKRSSREG